MILTYGGYRYFYRPIPPLAMPPTPVPKWVPSGEAQAVVQPGSYLVSELGRFEDELFAYLLFNHLRGRAEFRGTELYLGFERDGSGLAYPMRVKLPDNQIEAFATIAELQREKWMPEANWRSVDGAAIEKLRGVTTRFEQAYTLPSYPKLERLDRRDLIAYLRQFIRFKSTVDARVRKQRVEGLAGLDTEESRQLAEDIVTVTDFFELPLDFFIGIGAMENNYHNVTGDRDHAVWKRRAQKGDIIVRRRRGRVLVKNFSIGIWQITRETLRVAHKLYLRDKDRDYTKLPERLRPPKELDLDAVDPPVLTTYAGILLRDLLDRFDGDVATAVGAYNGGPGRPNMEYEAGVSIIAAHARRMVEQASALQGRPAGEMRFLSSVRSAAGGRGRH